MTQPTDAFKPLALRDLKVLLVDDFSTMRRIEKGQLGEMGVSGKNVQEAEDGAVALTLLTKAKYRPHIIFTDINMPNMNGFELLKAVKANPDLQDIPVVMVTAEARKEDIILAAQSGASAYIVKPFTKATLEEKLTKALTKVGVQLTQ